MFTGSGVAIVTPMRDGQVDFETLEGLIQWQIESGTQAIIPCGTTGEASTLTEDEYSKVVSCAIKTTNKRVPVIPGTGSNNTAKVIQSTQLVKDLGADGALIVTPYYNKPSQDGLFNHYAEIVSKVDIPVILYNVPGRTSVNMTPDTTIKLRKEFPSIQAIKDASGGTSHATEVLKHSDLIVYSGDDANTLPLLSLGAQGIISVAANCIPAEVAELCNCFFNGELNRAQELHQTYAPFMSALLQLDSNPIPIKEVMHSMQKCERDVRLPLAVTRPEIREKLIALIRDLKLIS